MGPAQLARGEKRGKNKINKKRGRKKKREMGEGDKLWGLGMYVWWGGGGEVKRKGGGYVGGGEKKGKKKKWKCNDKN